MTTQEAIIVFRQQSEKIQSFDGRGMRDEEILVYLNRAMFVYIDECINPKLSKEDADYLADKRNLQDLENIIVENKSLLTMIQGNTVIASLPQNLYYYLSSSSDVTCKPTTIVNKTYKYCTIEFTFPDIDSVIDYIAISINYKETTTGPTLNKVLIQQIVDFTSNAKFELIDFIIDNANEVDDNIEVYYEKYNDLYIKGKFIIVSKEETIILQNVNQNDTLFTPITKSYTQYNTIEQITQVRNSVSQNELTPHVLTNSFFKPVHDENLCHIKNGLIKIYTDKLNRVINTYITYIKRPRLMSIINEVNCELGSRTGTQKHIMLGIVSIAVTLAADDDNSTTTGKNQNYLLTT